MTESCMPWIEKTVKLQFMEQESQQAVQRLEACEVMKVTVMSLTLAAEMKRTIRKDGGILYGPSDSVRQSARVITAERGCIL